ncbi:hypothetical protein [Lysobacter sp. Root983]|uniref:hypothetical protein n=1 Tax=Lysobacter sp. Root983 TaxID=1736613 RepID=UPI00070CEDF4|nr:hypothetical protein [Lysobacter sp. Root983]KRD75523.1 hypothetical protein ASE43_11655 [Lysobacter sp. Root983]
MARRTPSPAFDTLRWHGAVRYVAVFATLWLTTACASPGATAASPARTTPNTDELSAFVPAGANLLASARGDLDGDGDEDALLAIDPGGSGDAAFAPRALLLLRRDAGGILRLAVDSPNAILCRNCGGMSGDPLQGIRTGKGEFTLRFEGGSRELWSSEYRFVFNGRDDAWHLAGIVFRGFDRADGKQAERRQTDAEFGAVALATFDPKKFPADALP